MSVARQLGDPIDWDRVRKSTLQGAGVGAVIGGTGGGLLTYAGNKADDAMTQVGRHVRDAQAEMSRHQGFDPEMQELISRIAQGQAQGYTGRAPTF